MFMHYTVRESEREKAEAEAEAEGGKVGESAINGSTIFGT